MLSKRTCWLGREKLTSVAPISSSTSVSGTRAKSRTLAMRRVLAHSTTSSHDRRGCRASAALRCLTSRARRPSAATSSSAISPPDWTAFSTAAEVRSSSSWRSDSLRESLGGMVEDDRPVGRWAFAAKSRAEMDPVEAWLG